MERVDTAVYFPLSIETWVWSMVIDSLKLIFPCDVFVDVCDRIQCHFFFFFCREDDGD